MNKIIEMYLGSATPANAEEAALLELFSRFVTTIGRFPTRREMATAAVKRGALLLNVIETVTAASLLLLKQREQAIFKAFCYPELVAIMSEKAQKIVAEGLALTDPETFWPRCANGSSLQLLVDEIVAMGDTLPGHRKTILKELDRVRNEQSRQQQVEEIHVALATAVREMQLPRHDEDAVLKALAAHDGGQMTKAVRKWVRQELNLAWRLLYALGINHSKLRVGVDGQFEWMHFDDAVLHLRTHPESGIKAGDTDRIEFMFEAAEHYAHLLEQTDFYEAYIDGELFYLFAVDALVCESAFRGIADKGGFDPCQDAAFVARRRLYCNKQPPGRYWFYPIRADFTACLTISDDQEVPPEFWYVCMGLEEAKAYLGARTCAVTDEPTDANRGRHPFEHAADVDPKGFLQLHENPSSALTGLQAHYNLRAAFQAKLQQD